MTPDNEVGPRDANHATPNNVAQSKNIPPTPPVQGATRPDSPSWTLAKQAGDAGETALADFFAGMGYSVLRTHGAADFDLRLEKSVEVKHDRLAAQTGNIALEVSYRGTASGIITTKAALWAVRVGDEYLIGETRVYRELVQRKGWPRKPAGDGKHAVVVLVPVEVVRGARGIRAVKLPGGAP